MCSVFAQGAKADEARDAGADIVGGEELIERIKSENFLAFDKCIATPDMMAKVSKVARVLGPRGLMPNPKLGTVTNDIGAQVALSRGACSFRVDKGGTVHALVGKFQRQLSDEEKATAAQQHEANVRALLSGLIGLRPKGIKDP